MPYVPDPRKSEENPPPDPDRERDQNLGLGETTDITDSEHRPDLGGNGHS